MERKYSINVKEFISHLEIEILRFRDYPEVIYDILHIAESICNYNTYDYDTLMHLIESKKSGKLAGVAIYKNRCMESLKTFLRKEKDYQKSQIIKKPETITLSKKDLIKLLKESWDSSSDYTDEVNRIGSGLSNFDTPHYKDFNKWIKEKVKTLKFDD